MKKIKTAEIKERSVKYLCAVIYYEERSLPRGPQNKFSEPSPTRRSVGMSYVDILAKIKEEVPECKTTIASLRWYSGKMQSGDLGPNEYVMPARRERSVFKNKPV